MRRKARVHFSDDWNDDMKRAGVIAARSDSLSRFTTAYARLARLPAPRRLGERPRARRRDAAGAETRLPIHVADGPAVQIRATPDQLEQLINQSSDTTRLTRQLQTGGVAPSAGSEGRARFSGPMQGSGLDGVEPVRALLHDQ
jgi:hypothetical protein